MTTTPDNTEKVRQMREAAEEVPPLPAADDPGAMPQDGAGALPPEVVQLFLPEGCPVQPLGMHGDWYFYLDQLGQLRAYKARDHSRLNIQSMFGRLSDLLTDDEYWPRLTQDKTTKEWHVTGWKPEEAARCLMGAAAVKGVWNPNERVRGAGAWRDRDGSLILHMGDRLLVVPKDAQGGKWRGMDPGIIGNLVYPTAPAGLRPSREAQRTGPDGPGAYALRLFSTWNWRRKDLDPYLMLGFIACAMICGALKWRPMIWTTGDKGTGKSSLEGMIKWLFGEVGLLHTSDATSAAVRQILRHASLPVAIDEAEAEEDGRRMQQLIKLARDAATGALAVRGGSDHEAAQFTLRSCFMFTSILVPPLLPQDRSRMAILELDQLDINQPMPKEIENEEKMMALGARLLRRMVDQWQHWEKVAAVYRDTLRSVGHSSRGQDVFGSLLAGAHVLLWDGMPTEEELKNWATRLAPDDLAELEGAVSDSDACLTHLLSTTVEDTHVRQRHTLGHWIGRAVGKFGAQDSGIEYARELLQEHGLKIVDFEGETWVGVSNMHRGLTRIFDRTQWASRPGAMGVWVQSLRRLPHKVPKKAIWFGVSTKATLLPLHLCLPRPGNGSDKDASAAATATAGAGAETGQGNVHGDVEGDPAALQATAARRAADTTGEEGAAWPPSEGDWEAEAYPQQDLDGNDEPGGRDEDEPPPDPGPHPDQA